MAIDLDPVVTQKDITVEYLKESVDLSLLDISSREYGIISKQPYQKVKISWPLQYAAASINIYASPSPIHRGNKINTAPIPPSATSYTVIIPVLPNTILLNFWVAKVNAVGGIHYLTDEPVTELSSRGYDHMVANPLTGWAGIPKTAYLNSHMKYVMEEIRRRTRFMIENDGEDVSVYVRRTTGAPCGCGGIKTGAAPGDEDPSSVFSSVLGSRNDDFAQKNDPDYQGRTRCLECFGTGIKSGFYPKFTMKIRYGNLPIQNMTRTRTGWQTVHNFNSQTLWTPKLTEHDVIVRSNGQRFTVMGPGQSDDRGGFILHQEMNMVAMPPTDIRQQICDELIYAVSGENRFADLNYSLFG